MCIVIQRIEGDGNDTTKWEEPFRAKHNDTKEVVPCYPLNYSIHLRKSTRRSIAGAKAGSCKYITAALILHEHGHERLVVKSRFYHLCAKHYSLSQHVTGFTMKACTGVKGPWKKIIDSKVFCGPWKLPKATHWWHWNSFEVTTAFFRFGKNVKLGFVSSFPSQIRRQQDFWVQGWGGLPAKWTHNSDLFEQCWLCTTVASEHSKLKQAGISIPQVTKNSHTHTRTHQRNRTKSKCTLAAIVWWWCKIKWQFIGWSNVVSFRISHRQRKISTVVVALRVHAVKLMSEKKVSNRDRGNPKFFLGGLLRW